ncbi:hypothetical protein N7520_007105 [Penicillium odoratum]|uniref:uncharacterized protein n=1 Tax=Penicillium odoratum TaxID=1167516 RepID=UPI002546EA72|nr:uncharacterized protein N7520_007105 [Penicillium odoratum]KAJ5759949.1 hypothetical protein N7520_007105 [Penicillium odoratum]
MSFARSKLASPAGMNIETSEQSTSYIYQYDQVIEPQSVNRSRSTYSTLIARQVGSGAPVTHASFWICCACGQMVNDALAPERCACCGHPRCHTCAST